jgi:MatE
MTRKPYVISDENKDSVKLSVSREEEELVRSIPFSNDDDALAAPTNSPTAPFDLVHEFHLLLHIAAPSVLIQFSLYFIFPLSASVVGRQLGTTALAAFSLGSLVGNLTCLSVLEGALSAADTLMPRAYSVKQFAEVGRLAIRGAVVGVALLLRSVVPLLLYREQILIGLGQDPAASALAGDWIRIYFFGVPPNLLFRVLMRFLVAQHKPWPLVLSSGGAMFHAASSLTVRSCSITWIAWVRYCLCFDAVMHSYFTCCVSKCPSCARRRNMAGLFQSLLARSDVSKTAAQILELERRWDIFDDRMVVL